MIEKDVRNEKARDGARHRAIIAGLGHEPADSDYKKHDDERGYYPLNAALVEA